MNFTTVYMYVKIFMCMKVKKDVDDKNLLLNIFCYYLLLYSLMRMHPTTSPHVKCYFITHYLITTVPS